MTYLFWSLPTAAEFAEFAALDETVPREKDGSSHLAWPIDDWNPTKTEARWLELYNMIHGARRI